MTGLYWFLIRVTFCSQIKFNLITIIITTHLLCTKGTMKIIYLVGMLLAVVGATKSPTRQRFCWHPASSTLGASRNTGFNGTWALQKCTAANDHCARMKYVKLGSGTKSPTVWSVTGHTKSPTRPTKSPTAPTASKAPSRVPTYVPTRTAMPTYATKYGLASGTYSGCAKQFSFMDNFNTPFKQRIKTASLTGPDVDTYTSLWHHSGNPCEMLATQYLHIVNKTVPTTGDICGEIYWTTPQSYYVCNARNAAGACTTSTKKYINQRYKAIVVCSLDSQGTQADYDGKKGRSSNWTDADWKTCPNGATVAVHFSAVSQTTPASAIAVFLLALTGGLLSQW
jgi:hypothetical protein